MSARDWNSARLSDILNYQMVLILTKFLQVTVYHCFCSWAVQTKQKSIPFGYLLHLLVQGYQGLLLCSMESS